MLSLSNIQSVTTFQRNPKGILDLLRTTRRPVVLTVQGKAGFVVQDAESYQMLLDKVEAAEDLEAIRTGLHQSLSGQGRRTDEFFAEFEAENNL
jgi:PHD/YefM family antitoxin component YafN of YafNO toxin-antitoxin module